MRPLKRRFVAAAATVFTHLGFADAAVRSLRGPAGRALKTRPRRQRRPRLGPQRRPPRSTTRPDWKSRPPARTSTGSIRPYGNMARMSSTDTEPTRSSGTPISTFINISATALVSAVAQEGLHVRQRVKLDGLAAARVGGLARTRPSALIAAHTRLHEHDLGQGSLWRRPLCAQACGFPFL